MSGALIGFAGAVGALGGVFINVVLRASYVSDGQVGHQRVLGVPRRSTWCAPFVTWFVFLRMHSQRAHTGEHIGRSPGGGCPPC